MMSSSQMWKVTLLAVFLLPSCLAQSPCSSGATRVARFTSSLVTYAGIVEVCLNGTWGTVCADSPNTLWSEKNAQVFCQGLGFSGALNSVDQSTIDASYLPITLPINYKAVRCNGTETSLSQCSHSETTTGCTHASDAAVVCRQSVSDGDVRLVGSPTNGQGAVEIYNQTSLKWYRVCPTGWTSSYANIVCQKFGYNDGGSKTYSLANGGLLKSSVTCTSSKCSTSGYTSCSGAAVNSYGGVVCYSSVVYDATDSVRLSGGSRASTGRVEVLYNGVWGTVCNKTWTIFEAQAVCNLLGYGIDTVSIKSLSFSGLSSLSPVWISGLSCSSSVVTSITQCGYTKPLGYGPFCTHTYDALVDCGDSTYTSSSTATVATIVGIVISNIFVVVFLMICSFGLLFCYMKRRHMCLQ